MYMMAFELLNGERGEFSVDSEEFSDVVEEIICLEIVGKNVCDGFDSASVKHLLCEQTVDLQHIETFPESDAASVFVKTFS